MKLIEVQKVQRYSAQLTATFRINEKTNPQHTNLHRYGHVGGVLQGLAHGQARDEVGLLRDVAAVLLEQLLRHGHVVELDLTPVPALGPTRDHLQQSPLAAAWKRRG